MSADVRANYESALQSLIAVLTLGNNKNVTSFDGEGDFLAQKGLHVVFRRSIAMSPRFLFQ